MPANHIQMQPGLSKFEFLQRYGTAELCEAAVEAARWPSGFVCPRCEGRSSRAFRRGAQPYRECIGCGYQCSLIAGTMLQGSQLPLTRRFMAIQLLSLAKNNVAARELRRQLGVSYPNAKLLKHKIMEAMHQVEAQLQLHGRVELDDAYLGGERSGGTPGRSSENKVPFVLAVQTTGDGRPHQVCTAQLPFRREAIAAFCDAHLLRPLTVVSDGLDCFAAAARSGLPSTLRATSPSSSPDSTGATGCGPCCLAYSAPSPTPPRAPQASFESRRVVANQVARCRCALHAVDRSCSAQVL